MKISIIAPRYRDVHFLCLRETYTEHFDDDTWWKHVTWSVTLMWILRNEAALTVR
jgi:hypothetical protein